MCSLLYQRNDIISDIMQRSKTEMETAKRTEKKLTVSKKGCCKGLFGAKKVKLGDINDTTDKAIDKTKEK